MSFLVSLKVVRLLLAVCVSVWLAGGCLMGCGNAAMAAQPAQSTQAAAEGDSCHTAHAHDCCAKPEPKQSEPKESEPKESKIGPKLTESVLSLASVPRGMMSDCPLAVSATAVAAKNNSNTPDSTQTTHPEISPTADHGELPRKHVVAPLLSNRGPTYLRCCVFLI